jgi:hypothetical protein
MLALNLHLNVQRQQYILSADRAKMMTMIPVVVGGSGKALKDFFLAYREQSLTKALNSRFQIQAIDTTSESKAYNK